MVHRWALLMLACVVALAAPARAQFYDLDGAYRCLKTPDPECEKNLRDRPPPPPAAAEPPPKPSEPEFAEVVAHVRAKTAASSDIEVLRRLARANDPRAVEVLAWCELNGLGTARDPVAAYKLYRQAAGLGVPHARDNQAAVFERQLTSEERQAILLEENKQ
ncbi:MAG TPA: hypothetical protein VMU06_22655 [Stellaceae bacterium]|nr:hypothetical protein [Stellaceae bacterium]